MRGRFTGAARALRPAQLTRRAALLPLTLLSLSGLLAGCGSSSPPPISNGELAAARTFPYYTVYWVGAKFGSHPLTAADGVEGYKPQVGDSVYYGDCESSKGLLGSSGCVLPLQVTTVIYVLHTSNFTLGEQRNTVIRGVPAVIYDEGRSLELYSGRVVIDIFSDGLKDAIRAAKLLRPFNRPGSDEGPLPLPVYCPVLYGPQSPAVAAVLAKLPEEACKRAESALALSEALKEE